MKTFNHILKLSIILIILASCNTTKPVISADLQTYEKDSIVIKDTIFVVEKDNAYYEAWIECQNQSPIIKEIIKEVPGTSLNVPKVSLKDHLIRVDCEKKAQELLAQWKENHKEKIVTKVINNTVEVNKLTNWQILRLKLFNWMTLVAGLFTAYNFFKPKFI